MMVMGTEVVKPWVQQLQSESEYGDTICKLKRGEQVSLYWIENSKWVTNADGIVQAAVPQSYRRKLFEKAHSGAFAGYLSADKIYKQLSNRHTWSGMRRDIGR
ncbi:unnamed protein product [Gongylonema pulchrum]|uniref:Integrase_H2C2 domain-containing protein n=1 Tax=Gongylonema pulchrum TaxID=637853 RepID=A0A183EMJ1_9BILA|nr:unnamed protein product [Gongylonema pulchrum]